MTDSYREPSLTVWHLDDRIIDFCCDTNLYPFRLSQQFLTFILLYRLNILTENNSAFIPYYLLYYFIAFSATSAYFICFRWLLLTFSHEFVQIRSTFVQHYSLHPISTFFVKTITLNWLSTSTPLLSWRYTLLLLSAENFASLCKRCIKV